MVALSESYVKTLDPLAAGRTAEAATEFHDNFTPTVKKLYSEAAQIYPVRFSKSENWCIWTKQLYVQTIKLDETLGKGDQAEALKMLADLREHINNLHLQTQTQKANDFIYAFHRQLAQPAPEARELSALADKLAKADPSAKAKANAEAYGKARAEWSRQAEAALEGGTLDSGKRRALRASTEKFYHDYGMQFE